MSNLPPGVSANMIPGNRPEDLDAEAFAEAMDAKVIELKLKLPEDWFSGDIWKLVEAAYQMGLKNGFNEGRAEGQLDVYQKWEEADESKPWYVGFHKEAIRIARFATHKEAAEFIAKLPDHEDGRYYLDGPEA